MNPEVQTGVAMAAIGMIGTVVGHITGVLRDNAKLRHDAKVAALESQNAAQALVQIAQEKQITKLEGKVAELEQTHEECEEKNADMMVRIARLEEQVSHKQDRSGEHPALPAAPKPV